MLRLLARDIQKMLTSAIQTGIAKITAIALLSNNTFLGNITILIYISFILFTIYGGWQFWWGKQKNWRGNGRRKMIRRILASRLSGGG
jgi:hypothetical protein